MNLPIMIQYTWNEMLWFDCFLVLLSHIKQTLTWSVRHARDYSDHLTEKNSNLWRDKYNSFTKFPFTFFFIAMTKDYPCSKNWIWNRYVVFPITIAKQSHLWRVIYLCLCVKNNTLMIIQENNFYTNFCTIITEQILKCCLHILTTWIWV